jgi:glycosyltransferase involved in cell wall biosynthesis
MCVARLQPEKGIDELIDVAAELHALVPDARVFVAGEGPEETRLRDRVANERRGDAITLLGRRGDVGELLAAADAFCLPSRHEGVPLSLLEAMAAGLPCVATAVGGIPGLVTDGFSGLVV